MASKKGGLTVVIKVGKHSWKPPRGMREVFYELLHACGVSGDREILMGDMIRGANGAKKVEVGNFDPNTKCILFYSQPGSKDRRHECKMIIPGEFRDNPEELLNRMYKETGDSRYVEPPPVQKDPPKIFNWKEHSRKKVIIMKSPRKERVYVEEELTKEGCQDLIILLHEIAQLFSTGLKVTNLQVRSKIAGLGLKCSVKNIYSYILKNGYITEERVAPKKSFVDLTPKCREVVEKQSSSQPSKSPEKHEQATMSFDSKLAEYRSLLLESGILGSEIGKLKEQLDYKLTRREEVARKISKIHEDQDFLREMAAALKDLSRA